MKIAIASGNAHKVQELQAMLPPEWQVKRAQEFGAIHWEETGQTFLANARIKVKALLDHLPAGWLALGDDSGLEVDALNGAPGVYSARYAGEGADDARNNAKLLRELQGVPEDQRVARFVCQLVLQQKDMPELAVTGVCEGSILKEPRGTNGFGYDPLFVPLGLGQSMAELVAAEKNLLSHRGKALSKLVKLLLDSDSGLN